MIDFDASAVLQELNVRTEFRLVVGRESRTVGIDFNLNGWRVLKVDLPSADNLAGRGCTSLIAVIIGARREGYAHQ